MKNLEQRIVRINTLYDESHNRKENLFHSLKLFSPKSSVVELPTINNEPESDNASLNVIYDKDMPVSRPASPAPFSAISQRSKAGGDRLPTPRTAEIMGKISEITMENLKLRPWDITSENLSRTTSKLRSRKKSGSKSKTIRKKSLTKSYQQSDVPLKLLTPEGKRAEKKTFFNRLKDSYSKSTVVSKKFGYPEAKKSIKRFITRQKSIIETLSFSPSQLFNNLLSRVL